MSLLSVIVLTIFAAAISAQQSIYQQCGGIGWTGGTSCSTGLVCSSQNSWYFQCLSATGAATTFSTSTLPGSTSATITPAPSSSTTSSVASATSTTSGIANVVGNPFLNKQIYANPYYASEISNIAIPSLTASSLQAKASAVADVGSFVWLDTVAKVPIVETYLADIQAKNLAGANPPILGAFVVYDLPDRDCAAAASNGEFSTANNGVANYKNYIDQIVSITKKYPDVSIVYIIEPDSLANLVTNMGVPKCANAAPAYKECVTYAIQRLDLPNVAMYLDAGHAGWLGWPANIQPAATLFGNLYQTAGSPAAVRGLATNVANYNAWSIGTCPSYTSPDANCDEKRYVNALAPLLTAVGFPAHFVTDTSRNGVQPTQQQAWGDWCNVVGTGFGTRPSTNTGDSLEDAFLWIKPGGECDGTSNTTATRYDYHCGLSDALQPAPEAGAWFQAYFQQLLVNANPSF